MKKSQIFNQVPVSKPKRNFFDLSHEVKLSGKIGKLIPILTLDAVPGDSFSNTSEVMLRFMSMPAAVMHRFDVTTHTFAIPYRLLMVQEEWENFITGGPEGTSEPVLPYLTAEQVGNEGYQAQMTNSSLWDYLGLPTLTDGPGYPDNHISSLFFRAYQLIFNEYYRDQNLQSAVDIPQAMGLEALDTLGDLLVLRNRCWEKDYFTSALPWTQRGAEVLMPIEGTGAVTYQPISDVFLSGGGVPAPGNLTAAAVDGRLQTPGGLYSRIENIDEVTFSGASTTINDLRRSIRLQEWLEANARGGARYTEQIYVHFGVRVPDYRLQRPEYIGGGKQPVVISEVLSTASTEDNFIGDMAGHGLSVGRSNKWNYFCQEHMVIMTILSVMPRSGYQQGVPKKFLRRNKFDFFYKEFANIGEQAIMNMELYLRNGTEDPEENETTFGYTPRYAEYKFENDRVHGEFRSTLDYWHDSRIFTTPPTLSAAFVELDVEGQGLNRIFNVTTAGNDHLLVQIFHHVKAKRPMPYFGVPSI